MPRERNRRIPSPATHEHSKRGRLTKKTAEDNTPKLEAAAERHKQTIDTKTPEEKQHEAKQFEAGKSFAGKTQFHSCFNKALSAIS